MKDAGDRGNDLLGVFVQIGVGSLGVDLLIDGLKVGLGGGLCHHRDLNGQGSGGAALRQKGLKFPQELLLQSLHVDGLPGGALGKIQSVRRHGPAGLHHGVGDVPFRLGNGGRRLGERELDLHLARMPQKSGEETETAGRRAAAAVVGPGRVHRAGDICAQRVPGDGEGSAVAGKVGRKGGELGGKLGLQFGLSLWRHRRTCRRNRRRAAKGK